MQIGAHAGLWVRIKVWADMQDIADTSGNCGSSFDVTIVSPDFAKKLPLARHKMGASTTS